MKSFDVKLDDHERRRRMATSAIIDMVCMMWPAQAHLRDEEKRLHALRDAMSKAKGAERDLLSDAFCETLERMGELIDLIGDQM
jgi:hypothetical protein